MYYVYIPSLALSPPQAGGEGEGCSAPLLPEATASECLRAFSVSLLNLLSSRDGLAADTCSLCCGSISALTAVPSLPGCWSLVFLRGTEELSKSSTAHKEPLNWHTHHDMEHRMSDCLTESYHRLILCLQTGGNPLYASVYTDRGHAHSAWRCVCVQTVTHIGPATHTSTTFSRTSLLGCLAT